MTTLRDFAADHSPLALNTATLGHNVEGHGVGWSPEQIIDACTARGYGGIVFWRREIGKRAHEIGERARAAGLDVCGLCRAPFLIGPMAPTPLQAMIDDFHASIDMAAEIGASCLTICVGGVLEGSHSMRDSLKRVTEIVAAAAPRAAEGRLTLALEPLSPVYGGNRSCLVTVRDAVDMVEAIGHDAISVAVDVYHVWWDLSLAEQLERLGGNRIAGYHLCDWLADTKDVLLDRGMMGDGVADLRHLRSAVEGAGYRGYCEVEIFSAEDWWKRDPDQVLDICLERFKTVC